MNEKGIEIIKASGERTLFSVGKLRSSLKKSGAREVDIDEIIQLVTEELYPGISTKEIYNRAFALLKKKHSLFASKYKLKKAIYELGPTGFPFERFVGAVLKYSGYSIQIGEIVQGECVKHEVDVIAGKNGSFMMVECKFHADAGRKCDVKIPLYIVSRFSDIQKKWNTPSSHSPLTDAWVATNTRFTSQALEYGKCAGLYLLSWDHPKQNSLKERIDRLGLHPITSSVLLSKREKQFLLDRGVVLCRELVEQSFFMDYLGISEKRKNRIINEAKALCENA
ncbi:ATPase [Ascidiimonas aurantiaca]|uniref:ATPase n=1 Tax=Ascidiimonas aurantiaca TaxID=1685432 RepID=UPI0030EDB858